MIIRPFTTCIPWLLLLLSVAPLGAAETSTESYRLEQRDDVEEIFKLLFGSAPPMATERGTVLLEAYHDRNGNHQRDPGEEELEREIVCRIDQIEYPLPAFIPGLDYNGTYELRCRGNRFSPRASEQTVFVRKRGQIIRMALPCLPDERSLEER